MSKQKTIALKLTQAEEDILLSALYGLKLDESRIIERTELWPETWRARADQAQMTLSKMEGVLEKIYAAKLWIPLEKYRAARRMAQKNPPADATNIHQGQASRTDLP